MCAPWLNVFGILILSVICSAKSLAANWTVGEGSDSVVRQPSVLLHSESTVPTVCLLVA